MPLAGEVWELTALDGYDTPIKDGYLNDVVAGDLSGTGRKDWCFWKRRKIISTSSALIHITSSCPSNRWQVFEQHTFRGRTDALPEPREALVTDVTGDKKNDLVVVVHDRILVYPQE
jgi:hypothetical protein